MSISREYERPLGLGSERRGWRLTGRDAAAAVAFLALAAGSAAISLRDRPWRVPAPPAEEVAAVAEPAAVVPPAPAETPASQPTSGPSIIRVNPDATRDAGQGVVVIRDPMAVGQNLQVAHLPDRALVEEAPEGLLPVRGADGRRPFDVYARPWSGTRGARVAIVIGGLGLSQTGTQEALAELPPEVTVAFAPSGNSLNRWMQEARRGGREVLMQVPLEPFDYPSVDPGRNTLTADASPEENAGRLRWALGRTTNYVGVMNYMGARLMADAAAMKPVMEELGRRGLMFLDDGSSARSRAGELAPGARAPAAAADVTIDAARDRTAILAKLDELERIAQSRGTAVGVGSAFDVTVDAVAAWVAGAKKRGVEIVPVSAVASDPERK